MNFLIFTPAYPPDIKVSARRWGNLVAELCQKGHHCTVITFTSRYSHSDQGIHGERIIALETYLTSSPEFSKETGKKKPSPLRNVINRAIVKHLPLFFRTRKIKPLFRKILKNPEIILAAEKTDYIISSFGPLEPFLLGRWLAIKMGKPWIADIRDSFQLKMADRSSLARLLNTLTERSLLRKAYLIITVGDTLAHFLSKIYRRRVISVYNGWNDQDRLTDWSPPRSKVSYLYYAGTIYHHQLTSVKVLLKALHKFPHLHLKFRLLNDLSDGLLDQLIMESGLSDRVQLLPPASPTVVREEMRQSAGMLVFEDLNPAEKIRTGTITGKLLGLMVSGVPGLAIVSRESEIAWLVDKAQGWYQAASTEECVSAIQKILAHHQQVDNTEILAEYHTERQAEKLLTAILCPPST